MKKTIISLSIIFIFGCSEYELNEITPPEIKNVATAVSSSNSYFDDSGQVEVKIFTNHWNSTSNNGQHHITNKEVEVADGFVCVGGGAYADWGNGVRGALLTQSRPSDDKEGWIVSSKDHHESEAHTLYGYAIGIKLTGVSEQTLKSKIFIKTSQTPANEHHPTATVEKPSGYTLISGGAEAIQTPGGYGALLTGSYPSTNWEDWIASSKDHLVTDKHKVKSYGIYLKNGTISGFGELQIIHAMDHLNHNSIGAHHVNAEISSNYVLVGVGAWSHWSGQGRMLTRITPLDGLNVGVSSKDHMHPGDNTGHTNAYLFGVRKKPADGNTGGGGSGGGNTGGGGSGGGRILPVLQ